MQTFEEFLENAGIDPADTSEEDLGTLRKSFEELQGAEAAAEGVEVVEGVEEDTRSLLQRGLDGLTALSKSPKMLADLLHHMQKNANTDPNADGDPATGEEPDDGGQDEPDDDGKGKDEEDAADEEELAATMKEMGLKGEDKDGEDEEPEGTPTTRRRASSRRPSWTNSASRTSSRPMKSWASY